MFSKKKKKKKKIKQNTKIPRTSQHAWTDRNLTVNEIILHKQLMK